MGVLKLLYFFKKYNCTRDVLNVWRTQWRGKSYYSCGTYQSRGVAVLIGKDIEYVEKKIFLDKEGRMITLHCSIQGEQFVFINTYAPNNETDQIEFFSNVGKVLQDLNLELEEEYTVSYIWGGDFNCPLKHIDTESEKVNLKLRSIGLIERTMEVFNLVDIWRVRRPYTKQFTWRVLNPLKQRRLDYFLVSDSLQSSVVSADIITAVATDHSAITFKINSIPYAKSGPSYWRLNNSLLEDVVYVNVDIKVIEDLYNENICLGHNMQENGISLNLKLKNILWCIQ